MADQHTPGPWVARKSRGLNSYELRGADGSYIGDIWGVDEPVPNGIKREHQKPNARLIAAAPELFAACKAAQRALEVGDVDALPLLHAALAKGEGR